MIKELRKVSTGFIEGLLEGKCNKDKCFIVSYPLHGYLSFLGYDSALVEGEIRIAGKDHHHYWVEVEDIVIDGTASQFKKPNGSRMPKIYIGKRPKWYHPYRHS